MHDQEGARKNHIELNLANETANELIIWVSLCLLSRDHNSVSQPSWEKIQLLWYNSSDGGWLHAWNSKENECIKCMLKDNSYSLMLISWYLRVIFYTFSMLFFLREAEVFCDFRNFTEKSVDAYLSTWFKLSKHRQQINVHYLKRKREKLFSHKNPNKYFHYKKKWFKC